MYIAHLDPEKVIDLPSYNAVLGDLLEHWCDTDPEAVCEFLADLITGPEDAYAERKFIRQMRDRAEAILERAREAALRDPRIGEAA